MVTQDDDLLRTEAPGRDNAAQADGSVVVLTRAPRLPQRTASAITRNEFPRFESW
jgi:hypothetical protein